MFGLVPFLNCSRTCIMCSNNSYCEFHPVFLKHMARDTTAVLEVQLDLQQPSWLAVWRLRQPSVKNPRREPTGLFHAQHVLKHGHCGPSSSAQLLIYRHPRTAASSWPTDNAGRLPAKNRPVILKHLADPIGVVDKAVCRNWTGKY